MVRLEINDIQFLDLDGTIDGSKLTVNSKCLYIDDDEEM